MTNFENIQNLIEQNNWKEVESIFSGMTSFQETRDGNPEFMYFFQNNIAQAIILGEKYQLISQSDIMYSLGFSSSTFRKNLIYRLLESDTLNPKKLFNEILTGQNFLSSFGNSQFGILKLILEYNKENDIKNLFDSDYLKTIFLKKDILDTLSSSQIIFKFIVGCSEINDSFLFNHYCTNKNYQFLHIIVDRWKSNMNELDYNLFYSSMKESALILEKQYNHPFLNSTNKKELKIILENLVKIDLFLTLHNKPVEPNKKNRHKI